MKDYINREKMEEELLEVLKEEMESFGDMDDEFMNEVKRDMEDDNYCSELTEKFLDWAND